MDDPVNGGQIAADCAILHAAASTALVAADIDATAVAITLAGYAEDGQKSRHQHFKVGDHEAMAEAAAAWTAEGFNTYRALVANRSGLKATERGGAADAVAVFGIGADLDGDKGNAFSVDDLPLPATIVTRSSSVPDENFNVAYLLTRAISADEARPIAWGLSEAVGDADGGTSDVVHVWRIAGTLNHPKASKLKRGRPAEPQAVISDPEQRGTGRAVSPGELVEAIEVALGIDSLAEAYANAVGGERIARATTEARQRRGPYWLGDHFDGDPKELARLVDALRVLPPIDRKVWREVVVGLCDFFMGDRLGEQIADAWSGGGRVGDVVFQGCPEKYDAAAQSQLWQDATGVAEFSVGTVFHHAKEAGWNSSRARWGLGRKQRSAADMTVAARGVQAAGLAMGPGDFTVKRLAWYWRVAHQANWFQVRICTSAITSQCQWRSFTRPWRRPNRIRPRRPPTPRHWRLRTRSGVTSARSPRTTTSMSRPTVTASRRNSRKSSPPASSAKSPSASMPNDRCDKTARTAPTPWHEVTHERSTAAAPATQALPPTVPTRPLERSTRCLKKCARCRGPASPACGPRRNGPIGEAPIPQGNCRSSHHLQLETRKDARHGRQRPRFRARHP